MTLDHSELVTAALLGTDRRPPGLGGAADSDPAQLLLAYAARSAVAQRAGALLPSLPAAPAGPTERVPLAPPAAQELLAGLLTRPVAELVNVWLRLAAGRGLGAPPEHWTPLVMFASRHTNVDRVALGHVLGPRGVWFCGQNAQWQRLATALVQGADPAAVVAAPAGARMIDAQAVADDPEAIFAADDPWPVDLVETALSIIGTGVLLRRGSGYAAAVGLRVPLPLVRSVATAIEQRIGDDRFALDRATRDALTSLERTLQLRLDIEHAFTTTQDQQEPL